RAVFAVIGLGSQDMILGFPWLKEHNPEIDWATGEVKMSRCPQRCLHCRKEARVERKKRTAERARTQRCRARGIPFTDPELEDVPASFPSFNLNAMRSPTTTARSAWKRTAPTSPLVRYFRNVHRKTTNGTRSPSI